MLEKLHKKKLMEALREHSSKGLQEKEQEESPEEEASESPELEHMEQKEGLEKAEDLDKHPHIHEIESAKQMHQAHMHHLSEMEKSHPEHGHHIAEIKKHVKAMHEDHLKKLKEEY